MVAPVPPNDQAHVFLPEFTTPPSPAPAEVEGPFAWLKKMLESLVGNISAMLALSNEQAVTESQPPRQMDNTPKENTSRDNTPKAKPTPAATQQAEQSQKPNHLSAAAHFNNDHVVGKEGFEKYAESIGRGETPQERRKDGMKTIIKDIGPLTDENIDKYIVASTQQPAGASETATNLGDSRIYRGNQKGLIAARENFKDVLREYDAGTPPSTQLAQTQGHSHGHDKSHAKHVRHAAPDVPTSSDEFKLVAQLHLMEQYEKKGLTPPKDKDELAQQLFTKLDKDGNGFIDGDEGKALENEIAQRRGMSSKSQASLTGAMDKALAQFRNEKPDAEKLEVAHVSKDVEKSGKYDADNQSKVNAPATARSTDIKIG